MYADIAASYDELHGAEQRRKLSRLLSRITLPAYGSVLDVGCATAHLHPFFEEQDYLGVDPVQELLDHAPAHVKTLCAPGEDLPLPDKSHELTLSLTCLHNYDDHDQGVAELARVTQNTALIGVLRKASNHDAILQAIDEYFLVADRVIDTHDTLLVAIPRRRNN